MNRRPDIEVAGAKLAFDDRPLAKRIGLIILATDHTTEPDFRRMVASEKIVDRQQGRLSAVVCLAGLAEFSVYGAPAAAGCFQIQASRHRPMSNQKASEE